MNSGRKGTNETCDGGSDIQLWEASYCVSPVQMSASAGQAPVRGPVSLPPPPAKQECRDEWHSPAFSGNLGLWAWSPSDRSSPPSAWSSDWPDTEGVRGDDVHYVFSWEHSYIHTHLHKATALYPGSRLVHVLTLTPTHVLYSGHCHTSIHTHIHIHHYSSALCAFTLGQIVPCDIKNSWENMQTLMTTGYVFQYTESSNPGHSNTCLFQAMRYIYVPVQVLYMRLPITGGQDIQYWLSVRCGAYVCMWCQWQRPLCGPTWSWGSIISGHRLPLVTSTAFSVDTWEKGKSVQHSRQYIHT